MQESAHYKVATAERKMFYRLLFVVFFASKVAGFCPQRFQISSKKDALFPSILEQRRQVLRGKNDYGGEEKKGLSLKVLVIGFVGIAGLYGTDVISTLAQAQTTAKTFSVEQSQKSKDSKTKSLKEGTESRGAMTRLTKKEINNKLQQVPVFFATAKGGNKAIYVENGVGQIFTTQLEADNYIKNKPDLELSATSLDDLFYTLITKKQKMGKFVDGVAGKSDFTAQYLMVPSPAQMSLTSDAWRTQHGANDIPLFRVSNLAFSKKEGLEIPLFFRREDALTAYDRLQARCISACTV